MNKQSTYNDPFTYERGCRLELPASVLNPKARTRRNRAQHRRSRTPAIMNARMLLIAVATSLISLVALASAQQDPGAACTPGDELEFICGLQGPEDLVQVPGTDWILTSSILGLTNPQALTAGHLSLIDPATHSATKVVINAADTAQTPYDACSAPPDPTSFLPHGLNIRPEADGTSTLFVVAHGGREAIEVFKVDATPKTPRLSWIGCVPAVKGALNNSVVELPDGRILATDFLQSGAAFSDIYAGLKTGAVYQWTPGKTWKKLPGTNMSGPNGIEVTPDLHYMFVAESGSATVSRYDLGAMKEPPTVIDPGFRTDNLRWTADGQLLLAGPQSDPTCAPNDQNCPQTLVVKALDPRTLELTPILETPGVPAFPTLSSALIVNNVLWLGSPDGDRVAYTPLP